MHGRCRSWDVAPCLFCAQTPGACGVCIDVDLTVIDMAEAARAQHDKAVGGGTRVRSGMKSKLSRSQGIEKWQGFMTPWLSKLQMKPSVWYSLSLNTFFNHCCLPQRNTVLVYWYYTATIKYMHFKLYQIQDTLYERTQEVCKNRYFAVFWGSIDTNEDVDQIREILF